MSSIRTVLFALVGLFLQLTHGALLFSEDFNILDNEVWEHELTLGGGGNWEFQVNLPTETPMENKAGKRRNRIRRANNQQAHTNSFVCYGF